MTDIAKLEEETQREINEMLATLEKREGAAPVVAPPAPETSAAMSEFRGEASDSSLEETVGTLKVEGDEPAGGPLATVTPLRGSEGGLGGGSGSVPVGGGSGNGDLGTLSMKLSGTIALELQYESGGQCVTVSFGKDAFIVRMGDGAEFRLPISSKSARRVS